MELFGTCTCSGQQVERPVCGQAEELLPIRVGEYELAGVGSSGWVDRVDVDDVQGRLGCPWAVWDAVEAVLSADVEAVVVHLYALVIYLTSEEDVAALKARSPAQDDDYRQQEQEAVAVA